MLENVPIFDMIQASIISNEITYTAIKLEFYSSWATHPYEIAREITHDSRSLLPKDVIYCVIQNEKMVDQNDVYLWI